MVQNKKLLIIVAVLAASLVPRFLAVRVRAILEERPVESLPARVGEWEGEEMPVPFLVEKVLPAGTEFLRKTYRASAAGDASDAEVLVTVVTSGADKRSIHRPERCLQGQGWQIVSRDRCGIPVSKGSRTELEVTRLVIRRVWLEEKQKMEVRGVVLYWFMGHDRLTGSNSKRLLWGWWDRVVRGLNYRWSYALLTSAVGRSVAETSEQMGHFAAQLLPLIYEAG
jgi:EpsI family protein